MNARRRKLLRFRDWLTDWAHSPNASVRSHDILEFIAYRIVDPLIWV